jgi:hypothetical protein
VSREVIARLEVMVGLPKRSPDQDRRLLERIRAHRGRIAATTSVWITNEEIDEAKRKGRP